MTIPTIIDTDIGSDIDDTWALVMALRSPELDIRLITTVTGDTGCRARIVARLLGAAGRSELPIGIGLSGHLDPVIPQRDFADGVRPERHPGGVRDKAAQAIVDTVMGSPDQVTVLAIGPLTNIAAALELEPAIAGNARFVGMQGSLRVGYRGAPGPVPEYNVAADVEACRRTFSAGWDVTVTPLDTCGSVRLLGEEYGSVWSSADPLLEALKDNYRLWLEHAGRVDLLDRRSSTLFDTVAVYLAYDESLVEMEEVRLAMSDDDTMCEEEKGAAVRLATLWKDEEAFVAHLVSRLRNT